MLLGMALPTLIEPLPTTLLEAVRYFSDPDACVAYLAARRWPNGIACPTCGDTHVRYDRKRRVLECNTRHPRHQFSVKVGTLFEDSPIGLDKWLPCVWTIANAKNGVSSHEIARSLGVTQKTAWFMLHRVRLALQHTQGGGKLGGPGSGGIEVDETYIGAKARNMHKSKKAAVLKGRKGGLTGKIAVMGMLERGTSGKSRVRLEVVKHVRKGDLVPRIEANVQRGTTVYTDALPSYDPLKAEYIHHVIDHAKSYAEGTVHTNSMENFWSLLKRSLHGTYVSVEPFHLFRYLDEQAFRFNERGTNDAGRFEIAISGLVGQRLTYKELTAENR